VATVPTSNFKTESTMINEIMRDFTNITDLAAVYVDLRGRVLSNKYNFSKFCKYIRSHPTLSKLCAYCDAYGGLEASKGRCPSAYRCHAGIIDISVPIIHNGHLLGYIVAGQTIATDSQMPLITARSEWQNDSTLKSYYRQLPNYSSEEITSATKVLNLMAGHHFPDILNMSLDLPELQSTNCSSCQQMKTTYRPEIKRALTYIDKNLCHNPSLRDIANHVYLSESYLSKIFKQEVGLSLVQYINERKLEQAKLMLRGSDSSIESIARNLGYNRPSYFCKVFKEATSETPHSYRRKYK